MASQDHPIVVICKPAVMVAVNAITHALNTLAAVGGCTDCGSRWLTATITTNTFFAIIANKENNLDFEQMVELKERWLEYTNEAIDDAIAEALKEGDTEKAAARTVDALFAKLTTHSNKGN